MFHQSISMFPSARIVYTNSLLKTLFQRHRHIHWLTFNVELRSIGHFLRTICALYPRYLIKGEYSSCGTIPFRFELFSGFCLIMHVNTYFTDELIYYNFQNKLFFRTVFADFTYLDRRVTFTKIQTCNHRFLLDKNGRYRYIDNIWRKCMYNVRLQKHWWKIALFHRF